MTWTVVASLNAAGLKPVGYQFGRFATEIGTFDIAFAYVCLVAVVLGALRRWHRW
jgi:hypothetical protein